MSPGNSGLLSNATLDSATCIITTVLTEILYSIIINDFQSIETNNKTPSIIQTTMSGLSGTRLQMVSSVTQHTDFTKTSVLSKCHTFSWHKFKCNFINTHKKNTNSPALIFMNFTKC